MMYHSAAEILDSMQPHSPELQLLGSEKIPQLKRNFASLLITYLRVYSALSETGIGRVIGDAARDQIGAAPDATGLSGSSSYSLGSVVDFAANNLSKMAISTTDDILAAAQGILSNAATGALVAVVTGKSPAAGVAVGVAARLAQGSAAEASSAVKTKTSRDFDQDGWPMDVKPAGSFERDLNRILKLPPAERTIVLTMPEEEFGNNFLHAYVMNSQNKLIRKALGALPKDDRSALRNGRDANGRTPMMLGMLTGAPESLCKFLMTKENVMQSDNNGVTPLMMAAVWMSPDFVKKMLELVPENERDEYFKKRDNKGRTYEDYLKFTSKKIKARFANFKMDADKDVNAPFNALFASTDGCGSIPFTKHQNRVQESDIITEVAEEFRSLGLQTCFYYVAHKTYVSTLANKKNLDVLRNEILPNPEKRSLFLKFAKRHFGESGGEDFVRNVEIRAKIDQNFFGKSLLEVSLDEERRAGVAAIVNEDVKTRAARASSRRQGSGGGRFQDVSRYVWHPELEQPSHAIKPSDSERVDAEESQKKR